MKKPRVLIAEDKPHILDLVAATLDETCTVVRAADGGQALALIDSEAPFDVVVTDVRMPVANGFAVLQAVQRRSAETQVVVLTAYASVPDAVTAMRLGAYDYLEKPFDPDNLALIVSRAAEQRRTRGAPPVDLGGAGDPQRRGFRSTMTAARERVSRDYLIALLREFSGNVAKAAQGAGLQRESLYRLLRKFGVRPDDFKPSEE